MIDIIICKTTEEIQKTFLVMQQLRPKLTDEAAYIDLVLSLKETEGYQLVALFEEETCVAVAGFRVNRCLFSEGKPEIYVNDFVTDQAQRGKGYGKQLFHWLKAHCKQLNCSAIVLDSGLQRVEAHAFYEGKVGMQKTAFHFYRPSSPLSDLIDGEPDGRHTPTAS